MSTAIDVTKLRSILLADGWHRVADKSFAIGTYAFLQGGVTTTGKNGASAPAGFSFKDDAGYVLAGPMSAILATQFE